MTSPSNWQPRLQAAALVLLAEIAHLAWEALHGGIRSHHFMQRADLPGLNNAWGLVVMPLLGYWAATRVQRRGAGVVQWITGLLLAMLLGGTLAVSFHLGAESFTAGVFFTTLALAVVLPAFRAECLLGWVLGMSWIFGALLPTLIGTFIVALSALSQLVVWPVLKKCWPTRGLQSRAE